MKLIKKIILWVIVGFLAVIALGTIPSFSSFIAIIIALLVAPIERWQNFLQKYIKGKIKILAIVVLSVLMFVTFPSSDTPGNTDIPSKTTTAPTTEPTTAPTTEPTTAPTTEPTTAPTTEPPHTHSFSSATCTAPKTCSCGATEGEANGHNWKDATYTSSKTCTVCGATEGNPLDVPGKENYHGHVYTGGESSKKYHYEAQCAGENSHEITWEEVERRNLGPCGTCVLK